jgi:cytosine deaminase
MSVIPGAQLHGIAGVQLYGAPTGQLVDITVDGTTVTEVLPHDPSRMRAATVDGSWLDLHGYTVFPAAADPHTHLDKALSHDLVNPPAGDLDGAISSWVAAADGFTEEDILDRARCAARLMLAQGTTAARTHVDVYPAEGPDLSDAPYRGIRALTRLREELTGLMTLQIVALVPAHTPDDQLTELTLGALDSGADLVGGAPHLAGDPLGQTDTLLDVAEARGVGCDLHTDEFLAGSAGDRTQTVHRYAERVTGWPADRIRGAGHCCRLSQMDEAELADTASSLKDAGIHVIALPATNLYLQGGDGPPGPRGRGIAPLTALRDHGVAVAAGGDNIRDPFNPTGRGDPLETASLLVTAAHQTPEQAIDLVTVGARAALGLPPAGPVPGQTADLLCIRAPDTPGHATAATFLAAAPADRTVISGGRLAAQTTLTTHLPDLRPVG